MNAGVKPSIVETIAHTLEERLAGMSPGDRLPTVRELMVSFGTSQFSVQQALVGLKEKGLIESQVGRGTFVAGQKPAATKPRTVLVLSYEQQSDRADELTRLMHGAFLKRAWRSVVLTYADFDQAAEIVESLPRFDACVIQPRGTVVPLNLLAILRARGQAMVIEGFGVSGIDVDSVAIDWPEAVAKALRHLYDLGHRQIGFVAQSLSLRAFVSTAAEFRRLHAWSGLSSDVDPVIALSTDNEEAAFDALERHVAESRRDGKPRFSAYIVYPRAFHGDRLLRSFSNADVRVPQDIGLVTLGYTDLVHEHVGRLDIVGQSAGTVVQAIIASIEHRWREPGAPFVSRHLTPELVVRGSTKALSPAIPDS